MPQLGLSGKRYCLVEGDGWTDVTADQRYTAVEYFEEPIPGRAGRFIGLIEDSSMQPVRTRIAFAAASTAVVLQWARRLGELGACNVELSAEMDVYPAVFFEDPAGTKLELCARLPAR